jgi:hypothetical protein
MLSNGIASAGTRLRSRTSCGSKPGLARDRVEHQFHDAKQTPERATPRYGRIGGLLVAADQVRQRYASIIYGPGRMRHLRGFQAGGERIDRVGAGIDRGLGIQRQQAPSAAA